MTFSVYREITVPQGTYQIPQLSHEDSNTPSPQLSRPATPSRSGDHPAHISDWARHATTLSATVSARSLLGSTACATPITEPEAVDEATSEQLKPLQTRHINTFDRTSAEEDYVVERLADHDDVDLLSPFKKKLTLLSPLFVLLSMAAYFLYLGFRIYFTVSAQRKYHRLYVMAWLFIAAEACVAIPAFFHNSYSLLAVRGRKRAKLRLSGEIVPTVDVFITCCKEDIDVVLDTTRAACTVDYPHDRLRVIVCDDGSDCELKAAVEYLRSDYPNLYYNARVKGKFHHFKAGNLIAATQLVTTLPGGAAEYIAALDADMIPEPCWLRAVISHLVVDDRMALVCPPQLFYNVPENDPLVQSLDAFVHVMEPTKDANGVAWCTGSGYAIRRKALDSINGWPIGSLAEDVYTSSMLLGAGWRTAFVHEALQYGTVPDTFIGHLKQRTRWTLGTLQTSLKLRFCLYGRNIRHMTPFQRLSGFVFTIDAFFKVFLMIALVTIPVVLFSGGALVAFADYNQLRWQIRLCFASLILSRINEWITYIPSGYRLAQREAGAQIWMAPYHTITIVKSFLLPNWLGGKPMAFSSSGSIKDSLNERSALLRAPLARRLKVIIWDCKVYMHLFYVIFTLTAVILSTVRGCTNFSGHQTLIYLLTHAFWPPMLWLLCVTAYCVPLRYAIWPPTVPDREELLDRDEKTGVAHPQPEAKVQKWGKTTFWHETQYSLCTVFTAVMFFGSFFI